MLCNLIVQKELENDPDKIVTSQRLLSLSQEIVEIFPKEHISTYFIPYISYGKLLNNYILNDKLTNVLINLFTIGPKIKRAAKGKLLDCFNNCRRDYKKSWCHCISIQILKY